MKLVIYPAVDDARMRKILEAAGPMQVVNTDDEKSVHREISDADAFFGKITPTLLAAANNLQWVQCPTASLEHYMFDELIEHPCQLSNMRGIYADVIADHVMGFVISFARNFHSYLWQQLQGKWEAIGGEDARANLVSGPAVTSAIYQNHIHLADCTMGVIGAGNIGSEICRRAMSFSMTVIAVDPVRREVTGVVPEVWPVDRLSDLLTDSDFVVIAAPHTPETIKMFRTEQFRQMKPTAYLINIGRGAIVDLDDLTAALMDGTIAGAGLDVFEVEPLPTNHPLWKLENVIMTPHVAAASPRIAERHLQTLLDNIRCFVTGEAPSTLVDKRRWF